MTADSSAVEIQEYLDCVVELASSEVRARLVEHLRGGAAEPSLDRLRSAMRRHQVTNRGGADLARLVGRLDRRTRREGFRALHAWDHRAQRFTDEIVPVLLLDFYRAGRRPEDATPFDADLPARLLIDYYLLHLFGLAALRAWDTDDPDGVLDRVTVGLATLQGPGGSGHGFLSDAEALLLYGLSQFHPDDAAYDRMVGRVAELRPERALRFSRLGATALSAHLRWGLWLMYGRDIGRMRQDNTGDYPWLLSAVDALLTRVLEATKGGEPPQAHDVEALLHGLASDPGAFLGSVPPALQGRSEMHARVRDLLREGAPMLAEAFQAFWPSREAYAPMGLHYNFPHNAVVASATLGLLEGTPSPVTFDRLLESSPSDENTRAAQMDLAQRLTAFSRASPDGRGSMLVVYDPLSARRSFTMTLEALTAASG